MGLFDSLFGNPAADAAAQNRGELKKLKTEGMGYIDAGQQQSQGYLEGMGDLYKGLATESGGLSGLGMLGNALGINGAEGNAAATGAFQAGPGYQFQMDQGLDALERRAAARGQLNSGNTSLDTVRFASGLADSEYDNWLDNLRGFGTTQAGIYTGAIGGQAASLGGLADLSQRGVDQKLNLSSEIVNGMMGANNAAAAGSAQNTSNGLGLLGAGLKFLGGGYL